MNQQSDFSDLCDDLDELITETAITTTANSTDFLDLDDLLAESMELKLDESLGKVYREQLKKGGLTPDEAKLIQAKLLEWESRREWETLANIALIRRQECACGAKHEHFVGIYYRQKHRSQKFTNRIVSATIALNDEAGLPAAAANEVQYEVSHTPVCVDCLAKHGFDKSLSLPAVWCHE